MFQQFAFQRCVELLTSLYHWTLGLNVEGVNRLRRTWLYSSYSLWPTLSFTLLPPCYLPLVHVFNLLVDKRAVCSVVQHLNTLKSISLPHFCSLFHSLLCLYADEELDREKLFPCSFSLFLLSGRSFSHHGLKFRSLIEVTVCLVVCISIRLTSAFFFFFFIPRSFLIPLSLTLFLSVRWSKAYFRGIHLSYSLPFTTSTRDNAPIGGGFLSRVSQFHYAHMGAISHKRAELNPLNWKKSEIKKTFESFKTGFVPHKIQWASGTWSSRFLVHMTSSH